MVIVAKPSLTLSETDSHRAKFCHRRQKDRCLP